MAFSKTVFNKMELRYFYLFLFSEEIAFYNGNLREKQTIHKTFRKLVSLFYFFKHFKQNLINSIVMILDMCS